MSQIIYQETDKDQVTFVIARQDDSKWLLSIKDASGRKIQLNLISSELERLHEAVCFEVKPGFTPAFYLDGKKVQLEHLFGAMVSRIYVTENPDMPNQKTISYDISFVDAVRFGDLLWAEQGF